MNLLLKAGKTSILSGVAVLEKNRSFLFKNKPNDKEITAEACSGVFDELQYDEEEEDKIKADLRKGDLLGWLVLVCFILIFIFGGAEVLNFIFDNERFFQDQHHFALS